MLESMGWSETCFMGVVGTWWSEQIKLELPVGMIWDRGTARRRDYGSPERGVYEPASAYV